MWSGRQNELPDVPRAAASCSPDIRHGSFMVLCCILELAAEGVRQRAELRSVSDAKLEVKELIDGGCRVEREPERRLDVTHV